MRNGRTGGFIICPATEKRNKTNKTMNRVARYSIK